MTGSQPDTKQLCFLLRDAALCMMDPSYEVKDLIAVILLLPYRGL